MPLILRWAGADRAVGRQSTGGRAYFALGLLMAIGFVPLAHFLPSSLTALLVATVLMASLSFAAFSVIAERAWRRFLQATSVVVTLGSLALTLRDFGLSGRFRSVVVACLFLVLLLAGYALLPRGLLRRCAPAQQAAFAATLISWLLIHEKGFNRDIGVTSFDHFAMAMRSLFVGPLVVFVAIFASFFTGWTRYIVVLAAVGVGQYGIGLIELGVYADSTLALRGALVCLAGFVGLLLFAAVRRKSAAPD